MAEQIWQDMTKDDVTTTYRESLQDAALRVDRE